MRAEVQLVKVDEDRDGQRIDNFLSGRLKGVPRSLVYRILRTGEVRVNGRRAKPDTRLSAGDEVRIPPVRVAERGEPERPASGQMNRIEEAIVHEDREFLVLDKPSGVASHGGSGISFGAIELLRASRPRDTLELVHRLDRDTSGVLVFARKRSALTALQAVIREGRATKHYLALLQGRLPQARMTVNQPLRKSILQGGERMVRVDRGRQAVGVAPDPARVICRCHAVRDRHRNRPHASDSRACRARRPSRWLATRNMANAGSTRPCASMGLKRLFLHAARFEFEIGERRYAFSAPLPPELRKVLDSLQRA